MATLETDRSASDLGTDHTAGPAAKPARPAIARAWSAARNPARVIEELSAGFAAGPAV